MNERVRGRRRLSSWFGIVMIAALAGGSGEPGVDLVLVGGDVWTGSADQPWAKGIAVTDGVIVAVDAEDVIRRMIGAETRVIELDGRFAMPGFIDTHTHFVDGGFRLSAVDLRDADTPGEFARRLAE